MTSIQSAGMLHIIPFNLFFTHLVEQVNMSPAVASTPGRYMNFTFLHYYCFICINGRIVLSDDDSELVVKSKLPITTLPHFMVTSSSTTTDNNISTASKAPDTLSTSSGSSMDVSYENEYVHPVIMNNMIKC